MKTVLSLIASQRNSFLRLAMGAQSIHPSLEGVAKSLDGRRQAAFLSLVLLMAAPAHAQNAGGQGSVTTFLQNIVNLITGTTGQLLAVIAVAIAGVAALFGAISIRALGGVVIGVLLIFSSGWIVDQIVA